MKKIINYLNILLIVFFLVSFRGYEKEKQSEAVWFDVSYPQKKINYYIEADLNGKVLMREVLENKIIVRRGIIKKVLVKDFLREIRNSEVIRENQGNSKIMFYKGESIGLSAYIDGELRRINAPMYKFNEAFKYAFNELKKEIYNIKPQDPPQAFIKAIPLEGKELEIFKKKVSADYQLNIIETKKLKENTHIFNAVNQPYRMLPIETEEEIIKISDFISENQIFGMKSLFYIGTTRGNFQCLVIDAK